MSTDTKTTVVGYRPGDRRMSPLAWYTTDRCGRCDHLVWVDEAERGEGKAVRCTVCLAASGVRTEA